jgi:hypothetical protein
MAGKDQTANLFWHFKKNTWPTSSKDQVYMTKVRRLVTKLVGEGRLFPNMQHMIPNAISVLWYPEGADHPAQIEEDGTAPHAVGLLLIRGGPKPHSVELQGPGGGDVAANYYFDVPDEGWGYTVEGAALKCPRRPIVY